MTDIRISGIDGLKKYLTGDSTDNDWSDSVGNYEVLTFVCDEKDPEKVYSRSKTRTIYRHRQTMNMISAGETWICSIVPHQYIPNIAFAVAVVRVDTPEFAMGLCQNQLGLIAKTVYDADPETVHDRILADNTGMFADDVREMAEKVAEDCRAETELARKNADDLANSLNEVRGELERCRLKLIEMDAAISGYEEENDVKDGLIADLQDKVRELKAENNHLRSEADLASCSKEICKPQIQTSEKWTDLPNASSLADGTYSLRFSADGRTMLVRPDPMGTARCISGVLSVPDIGDLPASACTGPISLKIRADGSGFFTV